MPTDDQPALEQAIREKEESLSRLRGEMNDLRRRWAALSAPVANYTLLGAAGPVTLSELFGDKDDLIVVHNMGQGCAYCTLWADGFASVLPHLERRTAFVVSSPDDPATQRAFAGSRGWPFRMVSTQGSSFAHDMGYYVEGEGYWPGVSAFRRRADGSMVRVARDFFGPGDVYNNVWHFFDLLADGSNGWQPRI